MLAALLRWAARALVPGGRLAFWWWESAPGAAAAQVPPLVLSGHAVSLTPY